MFLCLYLIPNNFSFFLRRLAPIIIVPANKADAATRIILFFILIVLSFSIIILYVISLTLLSLNLIHCNSNEDILLLTFFYSPAGYQCWSKRQLLYRFFLLTYRLLLKRYLNISEQR